MHKSTVNLICMRQTAVLGVSGMEKTFEAPSLRHKHDFLMMTHTRAHAHTHITIDVMASYRSLQVQCKQKYFWKLSLKSCVEPITSLTEKTLGSETYYARTLGTVSDGISMRVRECRMSDSNYWTQWRSHEQPHVRYCWQDKAIASDIKILQRLSKKCNTLIILFVMMYCTLL